MGEIWEEEDIGGMVYQRERERERERRTGFSLLRGQGMKTHLCLLEISSVIVAVCVFVCIVGLSNKTILKIITN